MYTLQSSPGFRHVAAYAAACMLIACGGSDVVPPAGSGGASSGGTFATAGVAGSGGQNVPPAAGNGGQSAGAGALGGAATGGDAAGGTSANGAGAGGAGAVGGGSAGAAGSSAGSGGGSQLPPITDYEATGPFATTVDQAVGPNDGYTVFRPSMLGQNGFRHAPIIFGPGIGQEVSVHTAMLTNFASHGFVVVGTPKLEQGPGGAANLKSMQDGLDWIVQQNSAAGPYEGKLAVDRVVSMGFSVGGTAAVQLGGHQAVATVVSIHGHTATAELHGPMLQTTGTEDDRGVPLQQATYDSSEVQTFLATLSGAGHGYIEQDGGGDERPAILAWMRFFIYGDMGAKKFFYGADCTLCKAPWTNPQRKNWPDM